MRALSFLLFVLFGAAAVISSNTSHPNRALAFGLVAAACFVIGISMRTQAIARLLGRLNP
jgi:uncharacterized membrane protein